MSYSSMVLRSDNVRRLPCSHRCFVPANRRGMKNTHKSILIWHVIIALSYLCTTLASAHVPDFRIIDMTHAFDRSTIYWVTEKGFNLNVTYNGTLPGKDYWYQKDEISAPTHGGTHLDAPCHFALGRWCVSDIPLSHLVVPAVVVDISSYVQNNSEAHLSVQNLTNWEKIYGQIKTGSLVLIRTGWSRFWPDPSTYSGTASKNASELKFPSITVEAAKWLKTNRKIVGVGIDVMSIDIPAQRPKVHITLMEDNIYGLENVNFPEDVPPVGATAYVMPMKLKNASGAPCRLILQVPEKGTNGGTNSSQSMLAILTAMAILWLFSNL